MSVLVWQLSLWRLPGNHRGHAPEQPIAFSHGVHAGELELECLYCHVGAERARLAGLPAGSICLNCHRIVSAAHEVMKAEQDRAGVEGRDPRRIVSDSLRPLYHSLGLDDSLEPDPTLKPEPVRWIEVYRLPDLARFDHRAHARVGHDCEQCHGDVASEEVTLQFVDLSMGWCVGCHRETNRDGVAGRAVDASTDCVTCHY